jgi:hypothetical protein
MSRLIDKLDKLKKAAPQPMGFRANRGKADETGIILIADAPFSATEKISEYAAGADAVYLKAEGSGLSVESVKATAEAIPEIPCGISTGDIGKTGADGYLKAGCDFLVFPGESPVMSLPDDEKTGKLIQIDPSLEDSLIRVVNNLPVDAVITTELFKSAGTITWRDLMVAQRIALLLTKPVIVPVAADITSDELKAVRDAGIEGILVEVNAAVPGKIQEIRQIIENLPPKSIQKPGKSDALLPRSTAGSVTPEEEEEDDYE